LRWVQEPAFAAARVGEDVDVVVAGRPRIAKKLGDLLFELAVGFVVQKIERLSQRRAPRLIPAFFVVGIAAAIAIHRPTPCAQLHDVPSPLGPAAISTSIVAGFPPKTRRNW